MASPLIVTYPAAPSLQPQPSTHEEQDAAVAAAAAAAAAAVQEHHHLHPQPPSLLEPLSVEAPPPQPESLIPPPPLQMAVPLPAQPHAAPAPIIPLVGAMVPQQQQQQPQEEQQQPQQPGMPFARPNKRHWLLSDQVAKIEDAFQKWNGNWRGKEPQLQALASELGIKVEKLKKRVDYMRRSREAKALRDQEQESLKGITSDLLDGDDFGAKRARLGEGFFGNRRVTAEPYHPPKCLFSHTGCQSNPEHGQIMTVVVSACGHRFVCLDCFNDGYNLDQYLSKFACCPTCREGPLTSKEGFILLQEIDRLKQQCKWCRTKDRNLAFTPCGHISVYCSDCFEQGGQAQIARDEICNVCEQKYEKVLEI